MSKNHKQKKTASEPSDPGSARLQKKFYFKELERLQLELVKLFLQMYILWVVL